jgi:hypothetical protein
MENSMFEQQCPLCGGPHRTPEDVKKELASLRRLKSVTEPAEIAILRKKLSKARSALHYGAGLFLCRTVGVAEGDELILTIKQWEDAIE